MHFSRSLLTVFFLTITFSITKASDHATDRNLPADSINALIRKKNFRFVPYQANAADGSIIPVSGYLLHVKADSVNATLPYYGQIYKATNNNEEAGLLFSSTVFDMFIEPRKKGGWNITIKPRDLGGLVQQMYLTIFEDGKAQLQVISNTRQSILYWGVIS